MLRMKVDSREYGMMIGNSSSGGTVEFCPDGIMRLFHISPTNLSLGVTICVSKKRPNDGHAFAYRGWIEPYEDRLVFIGSNGDHLSEAVSSSVPNWLIDEGIDDGVPFE